MTPHEKAVSAINTRLEHLQAELRGATSEATQQFLVQALVVTLGMAEALTDYSKAVGHYAQRRHAEIKQANEALAAQHTGLLNTGRDLLEKLKANPTDAALRREIARTQDAMAAVQKTVRRGANALQRELAPGLAAIDRMAEGVRRLSVAADAAALKRVLSGLIEHVESLYVEHDGLPEKRILPAAAWQQSAAHEIDQAAGLHDAYARAGYQACLGLELAALALGDAPPRTAEEATERANTAVAARVRAITARLTGPADDRN